MHFTFKKGLCALAITAIAVTATANEELKPVAEKPADVAETPAAEAEYQGVPSPKSYGYTALMVGLGTPLALPWGFDWDLFGLGVDLFYTDVNYMYGLEVSGLANTARNTMIGLQAAIGCNYAHRNAYGLQVAAFNMCNRETLGCAVDFVGATRMFYGLRADLFTSLTDRSLYGLSVAGLGSGVQEDMWGMQVGLGANFARRVHGLQLAAGYNQTTELRGAQVALVNFASTCSAGFQVGLVNIIMDNQIPFLPFVNAYF